MPTVVEGITFVRLTVANSDFGPEEEDAMYPKRFFPRDLYRLTSDSDDDDDANVVL